MTSINLREQQHIRRCFRRWMAWHLAERIALGWTVGCALAAIAGLVLLVSVNDALTGIFVFCGFSLAANYGHQARDEAGKHADDWHAGYKGALRRAAGRKGVSQK